MARRSEMPQLTARHMARYQRQMVLPQVGLDGQAKLLASRVLVIGAGALGSASATYLAAAGVGTIGLVDGDNVDLSNLHRQILHDERHIGGLKTESGAERLKSVNSDVVIHQHPTFLTSANVLDLFVDYDLVVNGSDNFPTRYLVNDGAVLLGKPLVDASILRFEGQLSVYRPGCGCYRCLFPTPPPPGTVPDCAEAGIFGAVAGVLGSMQAVEALKLLLCLSQPPRSTLLLYDALNASWQRMPFERDRDCVVCGDHPTVTAPIDYEYFCQAASSSHEHKAAPMKVVDEFSVDVEQAVRLLAHGDVTIVDVRRVEEFATGHIPGAVHCPLEELDKLPIRPSDSPLLMICAAGVRSAHAASYLRSQGYNALTVAGGMRTWLDAGHPVEM